MKLFTPLAIGPLTIKNRVVMPAMHLGYTPEGYVTDQLIDFYAERAYGGAGLIIVGGCPVDEFSGMQAMILLNDDKFIPGLARLTKAIKDGGALAAAQLYQAGRYTFSAFIGGKQAISASAVRSKFTGETPREMTKEDIQTVIAAFAAATRRAKEAGFDAVELLGSAGYLISQFLSPLTNFRKDEYGGSFENRMRFGLEAAETVRRAAGPHMAVIVRLAGNDFMPGSNTNAEAAEFAVKLEKVGVDCFNITGGWHETRVPQLTMDMPRGGFVYLAQGIKEKTSLPVIACNRINHPDVAEKVLVENRADLVGVARGMIADPEWVNKAQSGRTDLIALCIGCNQGCFDHVFALQPVECLVNPRASREAKLQVKPASVRKKVLVIGGGPAGLTMAKVAAQRGCQVKLVEKSSSLGGQINIASALRVRAEFKTLITNAEAQAREAGVEIILNTEAGPTLLEKEKPDVVVVATGGNPIAPPIPGAAGPNVVQAWDVLTDKVQAGKRIVVIGGGAVGCEVALYLAQIGALTPDELHYLFLTRAETPEVLYRLASHGYKEVTMIEMASRIGSDIGQSTGWIVRQDLGRSKVRVLTETKALEIMPEGVKVEKHGETAVLSADTVVLAVGTRSENSLYQSLKDLHPNVLLVGDADKPAKALNAVHQAFKMACEI